MHRMARSIAALAVALALVPLLAGTALAGGWAQVLPIDGGGDPPTAGEALEYRFRLLQHGVTPVDFGTVQLTATLGGETVVAEATPTGDGEWIARLTLPSDGEWQLAVSHLELETTAVPSLAVGAAPAAAAAASLPLVLAVVAIGVMGLAAATGLAMARAGRRADSSMEVPASG